MAALTPASEGIASTPQPNRRRRNGFDRDLAIQRKGLEDEIDAAREPALLGPADPVRADLVREPVKPVGEYQRLERRAIRLETDVGAVAARGGISACLRPGKQVLDDGGSPV